MINEKEMLTELMEAARTAARKNIIIGSRVDAILDFNAGTPRIKRNVKFNLILSMPDSLTELFDWHEIRCTLCDKVITYPCWYHSVKYAVNSMHYFTCFDPTSSLKPTTKCYRKGE